MATDESRHKMRNYNQHTRNVSLSDKCNRVAGLRAFYQQWDIFPALKELGLLLAKTESLPNRVKLQTAVFGDLQQAADRRAIGRVPPWAEILEQLLMAGVVNRPPIVRIHQTEIPYVIALINIGHTGASQFEQCLRKAVPQADAGHALLKRTEIIEEAVLRSGSQQRSHKRRNGSFIFQYWD